ncbi:hypothetical protein [Pantoea sp. ARC607]|uniref:hypothetical protein n=1 Tax=unclassified Pantoea TaxID=2630326 RepID=UPI000DA8C86E|nr:hypothetical protein [Pantoea sp. ARC607]PZL98037.1 hypothetical protein CKF43_02780 [Pantoea sp. ARC607]
MRFSAIIPHCHRWQNIIIERRGAIAPNGRYYLSTSLSAWCSGCGETIHRIYYRDISDRQARRWLG